MYVGSKPPVHAVFYIILIAFLVLPGCAGQGSGKRSEIAGPSETAGSSESTKHNQESTVQNLVRCPLSGDMAPEETINRRPLAVMVENVPAARPQSGLDKADVVYEILAEGGITRFLAVYLHGDAEEVGPVRSARPYFIERMLEYNAVYAYCGGSEAAKEMIRREEVASLDEFGVGRQAYRRIKGRKAPHNLYADTKKLREVGADRGYEKKVKLPDFYFLNPGEENEGGITAGKVVINYPKNFNIVRWDNDSNGKMYSRYQGGSAHRDAVTGRQLTGSNIIVQFVKTKVIDDEGRMQMTMVGRGRAILFTGGRVYEGYWSKKSLRAQTFFYGKNGQLLRFNPGQTWIEVAPIGTRVEYE